MTDEATDMQGETTAANTVKLSKNDDRHLFKIEYDDGTTHAVDVMKTLLEMEEIETMAAAGQAKTNDVLAVFKKAIGLPDMSETNAMIVLVEFGRYCESLKKHMPQLAEYLGFTDAETPTGIKL